MSVKDLHDDAECLLYESLLIELSPKLFLVLVDEICGSW